MVHLKKKLFCLSRIVQNCQTDYEVILLIHFVGKEFFLERTQFHLRINQFNFQMLSISYNLLSQLLTYWQNIIYYNQSSLHTLHIFLSILGNHILRPVFLKKSLTEPLYMNTPQKHISPLIDAIVQSNSLFRNMIETLISADPFAAVE